MSLKGIRLGMPAAERDVDLQRNFISSDIFEAIESGSASILIGNRGSGKSAVFRMLAAQEREKNTAVVELFPEDYSYELLGSILRSELEGAWAKQGSYAASWKYVLLVLAMKEAVSRYNNAKSPSFKAINEYLRDNIKGQQISVTDRLLSYMKRFEGVKIAGYEFGSKAKDLKSLYGLEEIVHLIKYLQDLLANQKVLILVDELDRGWDASEDARQFVAGLFQAAIYVNRLTPNLRILISLRRRAIQFWS